jgi:lysophospholipase L1-like esterase
MMKKYLMCRPLLLFFLFCFMAWIGGCTSQSNTAPASSTIAAGPQPASPVWAAAWGNSPENALQSVENPGGSEQSFRMLFYPTLAGTEERLHFSNFFGTSPVTIGAARLAISPEGTAVVDSGHDVAVTFGGSSSVTIPAGAIITSDPVRLTYSFGQRLAVSMYVKGTFAPLTQHDSQVSTNYETPVNAGDKTTDTAGTSFSESVTEWYLLSGMDVLGAYQGTVVLFGSSSIDGHNSNYGDTNSYPVGNVAIPSQDNDRPSDWLARQLQAAGYQLGVLNAGVLGDAAGPNTGNAPDNPGTQDGIDRLNRDVLQQTNVKAVVIYLGAVDIRSIDCKAATDVESSLTQIIAMSAAAGLRVIIATLPPSTYCLNTTSPFYGPFPTETDPYGGEGNPPTNGGMVQRNLLNAWIRSSAVNLPGVVGVADFDKALADPAHPDFMIPNLNSGDDFHPDGVGYGVQSSAIPLNLLLAPASN